MVGVDGTCLRAAALRGKYRRSPAGQPEVEGRVLYWAVVFAIIAIIAGFFGFGGVATAAAGIAKVLFFVFLVIFLIALVMGMTRRRGPTI